MMVPIRTLRKYRANNKDEISHKVYYADILPMPITDSLQGRSAHITLHPCLLYFQQNSFLIRCGGVYNHKGRMWLCGWSSSSCVAQDGRLNLDAFLVHQIYNSVHSLTDILNSLIPSLKRIIIFIREIDKAINLSKTVTDYFKLCLAYLVNVSL